MRWRGQLDKLRKIAYLLRKYFQLIEGKTNFFQRLYGLVQFGENARLQRLHFKQHAGIALATGQAHGPCVLAHRDAHQRSLFQARAQHLKAVAESQRAAIDLGRILGMARTAPVTTQ